MSQELTDREVLDMDLGSADSPSAGKRASPVMDPLNDAKRAKALADNAKPNLLSKIRSFMHTHTLLIHMSQQGIDGKLCMPRPPTFALAKHLVSLGVQRELSIMLKNISE